MGDVVTGRRAVLLLLALALATAGCLKTLRGAVGDGEELVWEKKAEFSFAFTPADAVTGASPDGVTKASNFTLPLGTESLRVGFAVSLDAPGNVTMRVVSPSGVAFEQSFGQAGEATPVYEAQAPEPGQWRVTIRALGQGDASVRADARVPVAT